MIYGKYKKMSKGNYKYKVKRLLKKGNFDMVKVDKSAIKITYNQIKDIAEYIELHDDGMLIYNNGHLMIYMKSSK